MPSNYQESSVAGTSWIRSNQVQINNPLGGVPTVVFLEQRAVAIEGGAVLTLPLNPGFVEVTFDPSAQIPLVDPWTGETLTDVNGTPLFASHIEAYIMLHSLYIQTALARDNAITSPPVPEAPLYGNPDPETPPDP